LSKNQDYCRENYPDKRNSRPLFSIYSPIFVIDPIVFLNSKVYIDKNGYFDQLGIAREGDMVIQRISDMLPYDYCTKLQ